MNRNAWKTILVALPVTLLACGADDGAVPEDAEVGLSTSALCTDGGAANYSGPLSVSSISPNSSYGSAACPRRYVVEATGTLGHSFSVSARAVNYVYTEADCRNLWVAASAYGRRMGFAIPGQPPSPPVWDLIGATRYTNGQWRPFLDGYSCFLPTVSWFVTNSNHVAVRVAAYAYRMLGATAVPVRVEGSVLEPPPPPH